MTYDDRHIFPSIYIYPQRLTSFSIETSGPSIHSALGRSCLINVRAKSTLFLLIPCFSFCKLLPVAAGGRGLSMIRPSFVKT